MSRPVQTALPRTALRLAGLGLLLALTAACAPKPDAASMSSKGQAFFVDPDLQAKAVKEAKAKRARGERVWCVPFARTASGVEIRGNAGTWWNAAKGEYDRGDAPVPGSVMAFASTRKMPMGHVAVVSEVVSERVVLIDHANWKRNQVSLKMPVVDVSEKNDWSKVRVESQEGSLGSIYPINGFIYPKAGPLSEALAAGVPEAAEVLPLPEGESEAG